VDPGEFYMAVFTLYECLTQVHDFVWLHFLRTSLTAADARIRLITFLTSPPDRSLHEYGLKSHVGINTITVDPGEFHLAVSDVSYVPT